MPRAIDLGTLDNGAGARYFLNVAGFGFDAEVAWRVNELPTVLRPGARTPYLLGVLHAIGGFQPARVDLELGDRRWQQVLFVAAVANGPAYGGGMRVAPRARIDDGLLDVCVIGDISRIDALRLVPRLYRGEHADHPAVSFWRTTELYAAAAEPLRCQVDGESAGELPATFRIAPGALQCVTVH
jgi:diacylglycerol kinase (ATP)